MYRALVLQHLQSSSLDQLREIAAMIGELRGAQADQGR